MAGPFPERTVDAVGACTRALAGAPDADALLGRATTASLGAFRAFADRLALRRRFHDRPVHLRHQPGDAVAAGLHAALEDARLDALGTRWLTGIAYNLTAHPDAVDDGVRWLAFEAFARRAAPPETAGAVGAVRRALSGDLVTALEALASACGDAEAFALASAEWSARAAARLPARPGERPREHTWPFPTPSRVERRRAGRSARGARQAPPHDGTAGAGTASDASEGSRESAADTEAYHAFTTAYDRVVTASAVADRAELVELRARLEAELIAVPALVGRLAKRLMRVLLARQTRQWRFDQEEGLIDGSRLSALVASRGRVRPFKVEAESRFPSTVVSLLIDHSGSMRGRPMLIAAVTVEVFARVLERCGVRCEVLGFTTREWNGGEPAREWAARGYEEHPGRLNALEHIVIKSADVPWRRARAGLGLFLHDEMLKENIDGEAVAWAHGRLLVRQETRRILVVVSDGTPMDEATLTANGHEYLDRHLLSVVERIEATSPVQLAAIGIGHDVSRFYRNATTIARIDDLGPALTSKLIALLSEP